MYSFRSGEKRHRYLKCDKILGRGVSQRIINTMCPTLNTSDNVNQGLQVPEIGNKTPDISRPEPRQILSLDNAEMVLLEVEQKFSWTARQYKALQTFAARRHRPRLVLSNTNTVIFSDTYYDTDKKLSDNGLWVRKRHQQLGATRWQAKKMKQGGSFERSTYEETEDPSQILNMVRSIMPLCPGIGDGFGLERLAHFETSRRSFVANDKFEVVLDSTDFGHQVGEVEVMAEDEKKAHADIDAFMAEYPWFFDTSHKPKGKLTAYFERFGYPDANS